MASVRNIGLTNEDKRADNEKNPASSAPVESIPNTHNKTPPRDSYWFAHGGIEDLSAKNAQNSSKTQGTVDPKEAQLQRDKEERIRVFREQQEEERLKKLKDLEQQFLQAKKHREQQEEERKRRIEEARIREMERRQQVEERKRQIWEAEQERKEAILRRNMEREARIEARRNAQRNSQCFAFGSSTPRTFDLDLAAIGIGRNMSPGSVLMSSVSGRRSEERELGPPRATSACSLDRKFGEDCMSRSMVSLSSSAFRGRKRTDVIPTLSRERSITPHVTPRGNYMRAVSMTRLDQLAQPRRPYRDIQNYCTNTTTTSNGGPRAISPSMTKSMCNLSIAPPSAGRRMHPPVSSRQRGNMSQSMLHLADTPQKDSRHLTPSPTFPKGGMRSAQSMMHLAAAPRLTRAARLRAEALAASRASSAWNLNKPDNAMFGRYLSPGKDTSRSPSRPQSSMSGASEISATSSNLSAVNMRPRTAPRRPRPYSIAGSVADRPAPLVRSETLQNQAIKKEGERQPRLTEKEAQPLAPKLPRAKSVSQEKSDVETTKPLRPAKKPVPPPKSKEVLAKAKSLPFPVKDNLRKPVKPTIDSIRDNLSNQAEKKEKNMVKETEIIQNKAIKSPPESKSDNLAEFVNSSPITSPVTDSDMCISSELATESDMNTYNQTFTESEGRAEGSESLNIPKEKQNGYHKAVSETVNIPSKLEEKVANTNNYKPEEKVANTNNNKPEENVVSINNNELGGKVASISNNKPQEKIASINNNNQEVIQTNVSEVENVTVKEVVPQKPRITSEEEAKAALAEKRRLAREQAEREAELERQRLEEIRRKEEEQRHLEELEQKRMEEEQLRLAELHRQLEAEKLRKAIEEQKQREKEEQVRREEEVRQKAEKEEQERKAREEAERQRKELEERLRKEEEERAERKRRVEQIMARTRARAAQSPASTPTENTNKTFKSEDATSNRSVKSIITNVLSNAQDSTKANPISNGSSVVNTVNSSLSSSVSNNCISNSNPFQLLEEKKISNSAPLPDLLNTDIIANHSVKNNGHHVENDEQSVSPKISVSNSFTSNRTLSANDATSPTQTNGYSSHEDMSCTTSPEEASDAGLLIDIGSSSQNDGKNNVKPADFTKLVDIEQSSLNLNNENYLINVDNVNSNILSSEKTITSFEDNLQKKSDAPVVDLLS